MQTYVRTSPDTGGAAIVAEGGASPLRNFDKTRR